MNVLELKAGLFTLKPFAKDKSDIHIRLMMDNTTDVACITKMSTSHSQRCNNITKLIWNFCFSKNIWVSAAHVPGIENKETDEESRKTILMQNGS